MSSDSDCNDSEIEVVTQKTSKQRPFVRNTQSMSGHSSKATPELYSHSDVRTIPESELGDEAEISQELCNLNGNLAVTMNLLEELPGPNTNLEKVNVDIASNGSATSQFQPLHPFHGATAPDLQFAQEWSTHEEIHRQTTPEETNSHEEAEIQGQLHNTCNNISGAELNPSIAKGE